MKNKIIVLVSIFALVLAFASCGENTESTTAPDEQTTVAQQTTAQEDASENETSEAASEEATDGETVFVVKNATVTVEQVEDISGENGTVFNASADEFAFYAVFRSDVRITDVKVLGLTFIDADENGNITFDREVLYTAREIGPDFNLAVHLIVDGSIPAYGISYVDADGTIKSFSVNMSGEDGSLYLAEIK